MKIGFDARTLKVKGGSRTYAYNLINKIVSKHEDIKIVLFGGDKIQNYVPINPFPQNEFLRPVWENLSILPYIKKEKLDIFHGLKNVAPYCIDTKTVITVHDITPLLFPSLLPIKAQMYWNLIKFNIKKANKIIAVSNTTKNDIINKLKIEDGRISVIYHGVSENFKPMETIKKDKKLYFNRFGLKIPEDSHIILSVSTIDPRKNYTNLIKALNIIKENANNSVHLLIVGKVDDKNYKNYHLEVEHLITTNNLWPNVHLLGYVPDEELPILYNLADIFAYPSLYEGFGLPILEAQACRCPVITSNVSSMPEIAGDSAVLVDPYSVEEIASAIYEVSSDTNLRDNLIQKGFENCKRFSWKKCAEETLEIYEEVYNEG